MRRLRILLLLPFAPGVAAAHGGGRSTAELAVRLAARHSVAVLCLRRVGDEPAGEEIRSSCELLEEFEQRPVGRTRAERIQRRVRLLLALAGGRPMWVTDSMVPGFGARAAALVRDWRPDVVQAEFHVMAQYLAGLPSAPVRVVTEHEVGVAAATELAGRQRGAGRLLYELDASAWRRYERRALRLADRVVVFSHADGARVKAITGSRPAVVPLGTTVPESPLNPRGTEEGAIVFVGNFMHPPNVEAALTLMRGVFPRIREHRPDARLYVVGPDPPPEVQRCAGAGIVVTGRVEDVTPYLDRAAAVCVPVRSGGGVRVKVLEALAAGKALVASSRALEGLDVSDRRDVLVADTDFDLAARLIEVFEDEGLRVALAARARAFAERRLGWEPTIGAYERLYEELLNGRQNQPG